MSRVNIENSLMYFPRLYTTRHGQTDFNLTGSYVIAPEAPSMLFLDPNGLDRNVLLPPIIPEAGQLYFIANVGNAFDLDVKSSSGVAVASVMPLTVGVFASSRAKGWISLTQPTAVVGTQPVQRRTTASPIVVAAGDDIINCAVSAVSPTCTLPESSTRAGKAVIFKDIAGNFAAHPLTISPFAGQTIDGLTSVVLSTNYACLKLRPCNDTVGVGWSIEQ